MTKNSMIKTILAVCACVLLFNVASHAQKKNCGDLTDQEIIDEIYQQIEAKYPGHESHVNVRIDEGVLTLEGWAATKKIKNKIYKIAKRYRSKKRYRRTGKCVKKIVNKLSVGVKTGCGPGQKRCGTICIPESETCNIKGKGGGEEEEE